MPTSVLGTGALAEVAGAITDFFEKLAGPDGTVWLSAFKRFLRKENPWPPFPIWKALILGRPASPVAYRAALKSNGYKIGNYADQIFDKVTVSPAETEVELVKVAVAELGFKDGATYAEICERAGNFGLVRCPAEVGPKLRLEYKNQPNGEWLVVAMEPLSGSDGDPNLFGVARVVAGLCLHADFGGSGSFWGPGCTFVFARRK